MYILKNSEAIDVTFYYKVIKKIIVCHKDLNIHLLFVLTLVILIKKVNVLKFSIPKSVTDMEAEEFCDVLYNVFPKLREGGGFTLFKCTPTSRVLEPLSKLAHSSPEMLKRRIGNACTYIVYPSITNGSGFDTSS